MIVTKQCIDTLFPFPQLHTGEAWVPGPMGQQAVQVSFAHGKKSALGFRLDAPAQLTPMSSFQAPLLQALLPSGTVPTERL